MRAGGRNEILASGVYEQMPLLVREGGELRGQTYSQAQGILAARAFPQSDGRVRVELVPELHHGQPRRRFVGDQAMMRLEMARPRRVFDDLTISAVLSPGTMLILTALARSSRQPGPLLLHRGRGQSSEAEAAGLAALPDAARRPDCPAAAVAGNERGRSRKMIGIRRGRKDSCETARVPRHGP